MELSFWLKWIASLLPKGRAFSIVINKFLKQFFTGIAEAPKLVHDFLGGVFFELLPDKTNELLKWSQQFGFNTVRTADQISNEWKQSGSQTPHNLQTVIQEAGFINCYVHEWWADTVPTARNPIPYIDRVNNNLLVNKIQTAGRNYTYQDGDGSQDGGGSQDGSFSGILFKDKYYYAKDDPELYPNYFYVCGEVFGDSAPISLNTRQELERLIYKIKPMHLRCVLIAYERADVIKSKLGASDVLKDTLNDTTIIKDKVAV